MAISPKKTPPSITFVVILYNAESIIKKTLNHLIVAIQNANWINAEILVVDDGSTDKTVKMVRETARGTDVKIRVHQQANEGRLRASIAGAQRSKGKFVVFIGARVFMGKNSLKYLRDQLVKYPERKVWNCHIEVPRKGNLQAQFWHVLTFVAWRRYLKKPRFISYGIEDFDYYPKGTGAFVCPKPLLLEAYEHLDSIYDDAKFSSDDTTLIRYIASKENIYMSPRYWSDYIARSSFSNFINHVYHRGIFLLDSYLRPGTRFYIPLIMYFILFVPALVLVCLYPILLLVVPAAILVVFASLLALGVGVRDTLGFCVVAPVFACIYNLGMWKGLYLLIAKRKVA